MSPDSLRKRMPARRLDKKIKAGELLQLVLEVGGGDAELEAQLLLGAPGLLSPIPALQNIFRGLPDKTVEGILIRKMVFDNCRICSLLSSAVMAVLLSHGLESFHTDNAEKRNRLGADE